LIYGQDHFVVNQNGRRAVAEKNIQRPERRPPLLLAAGVECDQPEILKERVDVLAVGDGAGRRRAVDVLKASFVDARDFTSPKLFTRFAVERDDEELVIGLVLRVASIGVWAVT